MRTLLRSINSFKQDRFLGLFMRMTFFQCGHVMVVDVIRKELLLPHKLSDN